MAHESNVDVHYGPSRFMNSSSSVRVQLIFVVVDYREENTRFSPPKREDDVMDSIITEA